MTAWPVGYALKSFDAIDSTNEEARRLAAAGERGPVWIEAARQTAGRGRRGRTWESPAGNLAATLLIAPGKPAAECAQLSFVAAVAAVDAVASFAGAAEVKAKWPNDVLADGRKLAGILLESQGDWLAMGVGINLAHFPPDTEFPATSLAALTGTAPGRHDALTQLAAQFAKWYEIWRGRGFAPIREAWLARGAGLGKRIRARLAQGEHMGVFEGIDETGALLLREDDQSLRAIAAGDVFFG